MASAYCNGCERTIRLTARGVLQRHDVRTLGIRCVGSGKTPEDARYVSWSDPVRPEAS